MIRSAGILLPVTALPSKYGIGTFGRQAFKFVDFLADAGQTYWQILPIGPTGFGNSPYTSLSSYAGNPYLIDLELLVEEGLLNKKDLSSIKWEKTEDHVDYGAQYNHRYTVLRKACDALAYKHPEDYFTFLKENMSWVKDYAVFMAIKNDRKGEPWTKWPQELRNHRSQQVQEEALRLKDDVLFYERMQYLFYKQLNAVKAYANSRNIQIIGDLPFYAAADSIDVWANPEQFDVNDKFEMTYVSGFGPDSGNPEGQKWGNPLFNWDRQRSEGWQWWIDRAQHMLKSCDVLRIDHFRGYDSFFAVPAEGEPKDGHWRKGPGLEIFKALENRIGKQEIIVEDLGQLTPEFMHMVEESGFAGMKILEYAFDPNDPGSIYMPWQYPKNCVVYIGTHDNNTAAGWLKDPNEAERVKRAVKYLGLNEEEGRVWGLIRAAYASAGNLAILQMQDILELDESARMNNPAGDSDPWSWRCKEDAFSKELADKLNDMTHVFCRYNWNVR